MKRTPFFFLSFLMIGLMACSDDEVKRQGDADITHEGDSWNIVSVEYFLLDNNTSGTGIGTKVKSGTVSNAGTFYFKQGSTQGSFELKVEGINKEDFFTYTIDGSAIDILQIDQGVGGLKTNQNVIQLSGEATETEMTLEGSIIKQNVSGGTASVGQFVLEATFVLEKE